MTIQESLTRVRWPQKLLLPGLSREQILFRRASLAQVDGFDPRFGGAKGQFLAEELDVAARISAAGWHGAYDPRPLVYHHHGRKTRWQAWRLMRVYQRGIGGFYAKCFLDRQLRARFWPTFARYASCTHIGVGWSSSPRPSISPCAPCLPDRQRIGGSHTDEIDTPGLPALLISN